jgi:hypothetical protein
VPVVIFEPALLVTAVAGKNFSPSSLALSVPVEVVDPVLISLLQCFASFSAGFVVTRH